MSSLSSFYIVFLPIICSFIQHLVGVLIIYCCAGKYNLIDQSHLGLSLVACFAVLLACILCVLCCYVYCFEQS